MDVLIQVGSGYLDTIHSQFDHSFQAQKRRDRCSCTFSVESFSCVFRKEVEYSPSIAKYAAAIGEGETKIGLPLDPMDFLKKIRAAGIPVCSFTLEATLTGITEKVPPEIQLIDEEVLTKLLLEAKKVVSGF